MTAVTDHDHTDHIDHMGPAEHMERMEHLRRLEHGSRGTGNTSGQPEPEPRGFGGGVAEGAKGLADDGRGAGDPACGGGPGAGFPLERASDPGREAGLVDPSRTAGIPDAVGTAAAADLADTGTEGAEDRDTAPASEGAVDERHARVGGEGESHERHTRVQDEDESQGRSKGDGTGADPEPLGGGVAGGESPDKQAGTNTDAAGGTQLYLPHPLPHPTRGAATTGAESTPGCTPGTAPTPHPAADRDAAPGSPRSPQPSGSSDPSDASGTWDDGLIARRVTEAGAAALAPERACVLESNGRDPGSQTPLPLAYDGPLRSRLDALRELVGLSRTRLDSRTLAEAGRVLDEAAARRKLSGRHTVVAIAGATGSGKSQLFNTLAGVAISETGVRRPTTAAPIACSWSDGAAGLIDRLGIPGRLRRRPLQSPEAEAQLRGLVLVDLPDHDSAAVEHRKQVDRILKLVDAVIWVVDPEKYADAVLHERYLRPMAGHAEIMFIVLNQVDRLPGDAADQVLDDLRRLLDEDGIALGEYDEPGATVLALSALTGDGVGELREVLGQFVTERGAAARRVSADLDAAAAELRPVYAGQRVGLSEEAREEFAARLADAVGATAAGEAAERAWLRNANRACGTPWLRLWRWYRLRGGSTTGRIVVRAAQVDEEATARQRVEQAVRTVADRASVGLPTPWAQAVREAAVRGSQGLSEALDGLAERAGLPPGRPPRPGWWPAAVLVQAAMTLLQIVGGLWLVGRIVGVMASPDLVVPALLMVCGIVGGPLVEWFCRMAARGPARRYGQEAERRLREEAAGCGRARVLDPVAAELLRYREVREQYGRVVRSGAGVV